MISSRRLIVPAVVCVFALAVANVHLDFGLLRGALGWIVLATSAASLLLVRRIPTRPGRRVAWVLSAGAAAALAIGTLGYGSVVNRSPEQWRSVQEQQGRRLAARATARFAELCGSARQSARSLARSNEIAVAVEGSDAQNYLARAFDAMSRTPLPRAHPRGAPGATLYDALSRPLAWSGDNVSFDSVLGDFDRVPDSELFVIEQGVYTYLIAIEPLLSRLGFVSVEIPLAADRRLQNRYLEDYDAIDGWLGRSTETEFATLMAETDALSGGFVDGETTYWGGSDGAPRLFFALRSDDGELVGVSSVAAESQLIAELDARGRYQVAASASLAASALIALALLFYGASNTLARVAGVWGARVVVSTTELPLSLGLDVDNPVHYASSLFLGLARSPIDFLLTSSALLVSVLLIGRAIGSCKTPARAALPMGGLVSFAALGLLAATNEVVLDAWLNSSLALSTVSVVPSDAARLVVQLGLVILFLSAVASATLLHRLVPVSSIGRVIAIDASVAAIAVIASSHFDIAEHVALAVPPFVLARVLSRGWSNPKSGPTLNLYRRLSRLGLASVASVVSFYPSISRFEDTTVRDFIEATVTPVVLEHGSSRLYAVGETAQAIDRMLSEGRLDDLARDDVAFRIWVDADLAASPLSSSIEIIDDEARVVSRFALTFPLPAVETPRPPAPSEWILEEEPLSNDPKHPGILRARRAVLGPDDAPWEIRISFAADWRNLPFISTTNPYLYLFRTTGVDVRFRYPYRELSLYVFEPDGTPVFQSAGGVLRPDPPVLETARRAPLWWAYDSGAQRYNGFVFNDGAHTFVLSYARNGLTSSAAELAAWVLLTCGLLVCFLSFALVLGALGSERVIAPRALWAGVGASFHGKLYVAFVLIALIPIASLAFSIRGIVIQQLERDVEQEGVARAQVVERFVSDFLRYQRVDTEMRGAAEVTDAVLEWVGSLAGVDVDLYDNSDLIATSKPELFGSGLLRPRTAPTAFRDLVLDRLTHSIHRESVGSFDYIVVSAPILIEGWSEPRILSLPLASHRYEIELRVSTMNHMLLLAAFGFSLAAAALAYTLANRIAGPIGTLTEATHRVADGDLDVELQTSSEDEIGDLVRSFTQMTADLKRQRADLEHTKKFEAWAEMARQVAHEVKNPLTPIQLSAEHLVRVYDDPNVDFGKVLEECSETILQQVKTLRQISMEFSTFASPEPLRIEPTDIGELVRETVEPYMHTPPDGVDLHLDIANGIPTLAADARLLKRTLLNLVENALHALNGGGTIAVTVSTGGDDSADYVEVSVADSGVGVDAELKERIFEPYFSTRATGTGLGLAIAKKVVADHGGTIELDSELGAGTTVRMRLPVTRNHDNAKPPTRDHR